VDAGKELTARTDSYPHPSAHATVRLAADDRRSRQVPFRPNVVGSKGGTASIGIVTRRPWLAKAIRSLYPRFSQDRGMAPQLPSGLHERELELARRALMTEVGGFLTG
jgi:hypothetical protein